MALELNTHAARSKASLLLFVKHLSNEVNPLGCVNLFNTNDKGEELLLGHVESRLS